jgi:membrane protein DedA with SNARE-associated domain
MLASSPPPELPGFLNVVAPYLEHYSYWAVLLLVMLEDFGVPVPGETILIAAAIFAGAGKLNVVLVGLIGFAAAVVGDNIGFAIGHFGGRALALRWGKYVFLTAERLTKAEVFFNRHGGKIIVIARFIEGLRQANGIIAGISGMRWLRFVVYNALGAALWVGTWVTLGYLAGNHINTIYHYITNYSYYALIVAAVLLASYIIWRVLRRRQRAGQPRDELQPQSTSGTHEERMTNEHGAAQENPEIQRGPEVHEVSKLDGCCEAQADPVAKEDVATDAIAETQAHAESHESATMYESAENHEDLAIHESAENHEDLAIHGSTENQEDAETQEDTDIQQGNAVQESTKTQSS